MLKVCYYLVFCLSLAAVSSSVLDDDNFSVAASGPTSDYTAIFCSKPRLVRSPPPPLVQTVAR